MGREPSVHPPHTWEKSIACIAAATLAVICAGAIAAPAQDPIGERAVLGYHLAMPRLQITGGETLQEEVAATVANATVVKSDGSATIDVYFSAETSGGKVRATIATTGAAGKNFMASAVVNGQTVPVEVSVARVEGCEMASCPGAVRATIHRKDGLDLNLHIPASK